MNIKEKRENGISIIFAEGNIAQAGTVEFREFIKPLIGDEAISDLLINFEKVSTIDSSGIGMIVQVYKLCTQKQKRMIITNLNEKCYDVFLLTRLNQVLTLLKTEAEGLELLK